MALTRYDIDTSHSDLRFTVRHMVISKVRGHFTKWQGTFAFDPANPSSVEADVRVDVASIDTNEEKRDGHLRSPDFFDAEHHPELRFVATGASRKGDAYAVTGMLTIRGQSHPVTLELEVTGTQKDPWGGTRIGLTGHTTIERKQWGLHWNMALEAGGVLVGEKVEISIEVEAVEKKESAAA